MLKHNRGLSSSLVAIIGVLIAFAIITLVVNFVWTSFNDNIQGLDESVASNNTKSQVDGLGVYIGWGDKLFMWLFIALIIGYLISAATLPTDKPVMFLVFMAFLAIIVFVSMILSNTWSVISNQTAFVSSLGSIPMVDYVLTFFPTITFFIGVIGAIMFFSRKSESSSLGGDDFE